MTAQHQQNEPAIRKNALTFSPLFPKTVSASLYYSKMCAQKCVSASEIVCEILIYVMLLIELKNALHVGLLHRLTSPSLYGSFMVCYIIIENGLGII